MFSRSSCDEQARPAIPTCAATARAVASPSPVTIATRTPNLFRLATKDLESSRGGS